MKKDYEAPEMEKHQFIQTSLLAETIGTGEREPDAKVRTEGGVSTEELW